MHTPLLSLAILLEVVYGPCGVHCLLSLHTGIVRCCLLGRQQAQGQVLPLNRQTPDQDACTNEADAQIAFAIARPRPCNPNLQYRLLTTPAEDRQALVYSTLATVLQPTKADAACSASTA